MDFLTDSNFNSIKVRLELYYIYMYVIHVNFNSIKVRLEHGDACGMRFLTTGFQFHKGAIRTLVSHQDITASFQDFNSIKVRLEQRRSRHHQWIYEFQFHKGAIRTPAQGYTSDVSFDFNSIKVRLELWEILTAWERSHSNFNSIKVRLERAYRSLYFRLRQFQFHKGAIRTVVSSTIFTTSLISIP